MKGEPRRAPFSVRWQGACFALAFPDSPYRTALLSRALGESLNYDVLEHEILHHTVDLTLGSLGEQSVLALATKSGLFCSFLRFKGWRAHHAAQLQVALRPRPGVLRGQVSSRTHLDVALRKLSLLREDLVPGHLALLEAALTRNLDSIPDLLHAITLAAELRRALAAREAPVDESVTAALARSELVLARHGKSLPSDLESDLQRATQALRRFGGDDDEHAADETIRHLDEAFIIAATAVRWGVLDSRGLAACAERAQAQALELITVGASGLGQAAERRWRALAIDQERPEDYEWMLTLADASDAVASVFEALSTGPEKAEPLPAATVPSFMAGPGVPRTLLDLARDVGFFMATARVGGGAASAPVRGGQAPRHDESALKVSVNETVTVVLTNTASFPVWTALVEEPLDPSGDEPVQTELAAAASQVQELNIPSPGSYRLLAVATRQPVADLLRRLADPSSLGDELVGAVALALEVAEVTEVVFVIRGTSPTSPGRGALEWLMSALEAENEVMPRAGNAGDRSPPIVAFTIETIDGAPLTFSPGPEGSVRVELEGVEGEFDLRLEGSDEPLAPVAAHRWQLTAAHIRALASGGALRLVRRG